MTRLTKHLWKPAIGLLLLTGGLLGLTPPLGKMATESGVSPIVWAFVISAGAGSVLLFVVLWRQNHLPLTTRSLRYFTIGAVISYALPNVMMFSAISHLGAGYTSIMFTLSPVITLVLSVLLGVERPNLLGIAGIAVGFIGAVLVATTRGQIGKPAEVSWILLGLLIPVSLAFGNIYRTIDWPEGAEPLQLAVGTHLAAAAILIAGLLIYGGGPALLVLVDMPLLVFAQVAVAATMFAFFFRLQQIGGPIYLSQIGYVAAAVALLVSVLFLGERYALLTWLGAGIVAIGVIMTTRARQMA
jgi:drug/metabolite transporter (DMT)-like permease